MSDGRSERLNKLSRQARVSEDSVSSWASRAQRSRRAMYWFAAVAVVLVLLTAILVPVLGGYFDERTVTTHVVSKENVCKSNGNNGVTCEYLIFTDNGTFKITDALFGTVRFNSSDIYGRVREDKDYTIVYYGWRIPFFSQYPNIKSITPASP